MVAVIKSLVCDKWGVDIADVLGRARSQPLPLVRCMIAKFLRDNTDMSLSEIGKELKRDHSAISYYLGLYTALYDYEKDFRIFADEIAEALDDIRFNDFIA